MKALTTEDFIKRAKLISPEYNYSKVEYKNAQTKVCIICHEKDEFGEEHGEFWVKPFNFLGGAKCPKCLKTQWTTELLIKKSKSIYGDRFDYSKTVFTGVRNKVCFISHEIGRDGKEIGEFWQFINSHLKGNLPYIFPHKTGEKAECWETRVCPICGKKFKVRKKYEKITCSEPCRLKYIELHKDDIYKNALSKRLKTISEYTEERKEKIKEKRKQTNIERFGKPNFSQTEKGRKISSENMKSFKKDYDKKYKEEILIPKYRNICEKDNLELVKFNNRFDCDVKCKICGSEFKTKTLGYLTDGTTQNRCKVCHPFQEISGPTLFELEFEEFIKKNDIKYVKNCRSIISPLEIDFYLPEYNIGVELNGLYWHSEIYKDNDYHLNKTLAAAEKGVRLIHIFEDEWIYKKEICESRILSILGKSKRIYARNCEIKEIDGKITRDFLIQNHIQGYAASKYNIGLFCGNELISVMTFCELRRNIGYNKEKNAFELLRFANKLGLNVTGGASKLLTFFIRNYNPSKIISYADRRWSVGNLYEKIGFSFVRDTKPNYSYVFGNERKNRFGLRKNILVEKYDCPPEKTEREFCLEQKWYRIYDCGNKLYELKP